MGALAHRARPRVHLRTEQYHGCTRARNKTTGALALGSFYTTCPVRDEFLSLSDARKSEEQLASATLHQEIGYVCPSRLALRTFLGRLSDSQIVWSWGPSRKTNTLYAPPLQRCYDYWWHLTVGQGLQPHVCILVWTRFHSLSLDFNRGSAW
jgi:hypothetical protein